MDREEPGELAGAEVHSRIKEGVEAAIEHVLEEGTRKHLRAGGRERTPLRHARWEKRRLKGFDQLKETLEEMLPERYSPQTQRSTQTSRHNPLPASLHHFSATLATRRCRDRDGVGVSGAVGVPGLHIVGVGGPRRHQGVEELGPRQTAVVQAPVAVDIVGGGPT
jgi:hypothetical protein